MLKNQLWKLTRLLLVTVTACGCALAQYGGGTMGGGTNGTGGYTPNSRSYGHGAVIGAAVGAGAGATVLFLALRHHHKQVMGCVGQDGKTLTTDNDKHTYQLTGSPMTAGEHLSLVGKKQKNDTGVDELRVMSVKKDLGQCTEQAGLVDQHP